ncbi:MAG: lycopene cyclase family protein [Promethearchaeota archaeon]
MQIQPFETDIVIIGGSIAGNYLASLLAREKIHCCVIEVHKSFATRPLQCAGILSRKLLDLVDFPREIILNRIKIANIIAPNGLSIPMQGQEEPLIIDRLKFDNYFGNSAQSLGVKYYFGEKYLTHRYLTNGLVRVFTTKHQITAKILVGADGPFSQVAKQFGIKNNLLIASQVRARYSYPKNQTCMKFDPRWPELFSYIVPEGLNGICRIGLATKRRPGYNLNQYLASLGVESKDIISRQGGVIPFGFPKHFAFRNTVLLGDSACMVKATTGGGIIMLLSATKILAPVIIEALKKKEYSRKYFIRHYFHPVQRKIGLQLKIHYMIRLVLLQISSEDFNSFFNLYSSSKLPKIIEKYADMDFPLTLIIRLLLFRPFLVFFLRIIVRNFLHFQNLQKFLKDMKIFF